MAIPIYLAMTAAEFTGRADLPEKMAWMACHFSAYGTSLSNLPQALPPGSLLIVNDRTPVHGHDANAVAETLGQIVETHSCSGILLDFQRPGCPETAKIAQKLTTLPCPVCVSDQYAGELCCPVFLPPVPPHMPVWEYLSPWNGREIWLEASMEAEELTLTETGCASSSGFSSPSDAPEHTDSSLFCHYRIAVEKDKVRFCLYRSREDLSALLEKAADFGVTRAVGLWQELK